MPELSAPADQGGMLRMRTLRNGDFTITRLTQGSSAHAEFLEDQAEDAYILSIKMRAPRSFELQAGGEQLLRVRNEALPRGCLCLLHKEQRLHLAIDAPFDIMQISFPQRALDQAANQQSLPPSQLQLPEPGIYDPTVAALGNALLPALEHPAQTSQLFVSSAMQALVAHLLHSYGSKPVPDIRGGLAPWQEQRAKEMLAQKIDGDISIADIAAACRLSPGHFATAFKRSTGYSPSGWLGHLRIDRARALLKRGQLSLSEVASATGFSDQAHFSRAFARLVGMSPGAWRRLQ